MTRPPTRVVLVPGVLALLPEYAGLSDPVAELRAACLAAVAWLGAEGGFGVHGSAQGLRLARHLAAGAGVEVDLVPQHPGAVLVVGNGSAARTEKAPGHLHAGAAGFDERLRTALVAPDPVALAGLDLHLAADLWADVESLVWLGAEALSAGHQARVDYDDDPFGVQYWVVRWSLI
ncbi:hypothetical protein BH09ACT12_BH09ACT12_26910 [soil metagenome]